MFLLNYFVFKRVNSKRNKSHFFFYIVPPFHLLQLIRIGRGILILFKRMQITGRQQGTKRAQGVHKQSYYQLTIRNILFDENCFKLQP